MGCYTQREVLSVAHFGFFFFSWKVRFWTHLDHSPNMALPGTLGKLLNLDRPQLNSLLNENDDNDTSRWYVKNDEGIYMQSTQKVPGNYSESGSVCRYCAFTLGHLSHFFYSFKRCLSCTCLGLALSVVFLHISCLPLHLNLLSRSHYFHYMDANTASRR